MSLKKTTFILLFFCTISTLAQENITTFSFDTKYYDAVEKWVAFPTENDSTFTLGFIYIDQTAGFTFRLNNTIKLKDNTITLKESELLKTGMMIYRLAPNTKLCHTLNKKQVEELNLETKPKWLETYKYNSESVDYLKSIGYFYNHVGASHNAIKPLLLGYKKDSTYQGLAFELSFAYNATGQYEKAIPIAKKALKKSKDQYLIKELGYALMNLKKISEAEKVFLEGIKLADDSTIKSEMAINMCALLLHSKNLIKFDEWIEIAKKHTDQDSQLYNNILYLDNERKKLE
jgi:tetratricopeptide (TPR) repeat protein